MALALFFSSIYKLVSWYIVESKLDEENKVSCRLEANADKWRRAGIAIADELSFEKSSVPTLVKLAYEKIVGLNVKAF